MNIQKIRTPEKHSYHLIAVPGEKLELEASEIEALQDEQGKMYDVTEWYEARKWEPWPLGLMTLATGIPLTKEKVFEVYKDSEKIYIFIAKERILK